MEWDAGILGRVLRDRYSPWAGQLRVCWIVTASSGRKALAEAILAQPAVDGLLVVPLVLREDLFESPNAVLEDLKRLVETSREAIEAQTADATPDHTVVLVVVSLCALKVPQVSSVVELPAWMPAFGGLALPILIEDFETSAVGPPDTPVARIEVLKKRLFDCDQALTRRVRQTSQERHAVGPFWEDIRISSKPDDGLQPFLEGAIEYLSGIQNFAGYRPSVKDGNTIVARVVRLVGSNSPDFLAKSGERFLNALVLDEAAEAELRSSLFGMLARTAQPVPSRRRAIGANLLCTAFAAHQFTTAAAHSDSYPPLLLSAMSATSVDIAETLSVLVQQVSLAAV